jgi:hypothetical protein
MGVLADRGSEAAIQLLNTTLQRILAGYSNKDCCVKYISPTTTHIPEKRYIQY